MSVAGAALKARHGDAYLPGRSPSQRIVAAVPDGSRRARGQAEWVRTVQEHQDVLALRAHGRANLLAVAWVLARHADWDDMTTWPTWPVLIERTGLARRTVARWLERLQHAGLLGVVESGSTPQFRPMALRGSEENRAAVYVLAVPSPVMPEQGTPSSQEGVERPGSRLSTAESGTPTWLLLDQEKDPNARARVEQEPGPLRGPDRADGGEHWPRTRAAGSRRERLELVRRLQREAPDLRRLTDVSLRHLLRPWLLAGWTVAELVHALDHEPDGTERTWTTAVRSPGGWLLSRLQPWTITPGVACSPPSVALRASESVERAAAEAQRGERAAAAAQRDASVAFGRRLEEVAGPHLYADLLEVVVARHFAGAGLRRTFAAATAALVRVEVRAQLCPFCRADTGPHEPCQALVATDAELLAAANRAHAG